MQERDKIRVLERSIFIHVWMDSLCATCEGFVLFVQCEVSITPQIDAWVHEQLNNMNFSLCWVVMQFFFLTALFSS
jgi:hypothetical protein